VYSRFDSRGGGAKEEVMTLKELDQFILKNGYEIRLGFSKHGHSVSISKNNRSVKVIRPTTEEALKEAHELMSNLEEYR
jgi:hypothetical protein